ncbi:MAG: gas vesicle protein GvpO, partial [Pseudomonadota bacterium]
GSGLTNAIASARLAVTGITDQKIDGVARCQKNGDGIWTVVVDVIDSPARMGENDLLAAYEVHVDAQCEVIYCARTHRYRREDREAS